VFGGDGTSDADPDRISEGLARMWISGVRGNEDRDGLLGGNEVCLGEILSGHDRELDRLYRERERLSEELRKHTEVLRELVQVGREGFVHVSRGEGGE
jgi:hypothetical protein